MLINRSRSQLVVIDIQDKLAAAIPNNKELCACATRLVDTASQLHIPTTLTEHCSDKIGSTLAPLRSRFTDDQIIQKRHFSACAENNFQNRVRDADRPQVIICGMEAHVCVLQTSLHLQLHGFNTFIVDDASGSRRHNDKAVAFDRARQEGVRIVSAEMVMFEWLEHADTSEFKSVLALIKSS